WISTGVQLFNWRRGRGPLRSLQCGPVSGIVCRQTTTLWRGGYSSVQGSHVPELLRVISAIRAYIYTRLNVTYRTKLMCDRITPILERTEVDFATSPSSATLLP
ncbi:unnamed protein product, partial [Ectocarpus sp. 8 AP-2014]